MLEYDSYIGRVAVGRIFHGKIEVGNQIVAVKRDGTIAKGKVTKLLAYQGLTRVESESAASRRHYFPGRRSRRSCWRNPRLPTKPG